jgi:hypothetical protein
MSDERARLILGGDVPQLDRSIEPARGEESAVESIGDGRDGLFVAGQFPGPLRCDELGGEKERCGGGDATPEGSPEEGAHDRFSRNIALKFWTEFVGDNCNVAAGAAGRNEPVTMKCQRRGWGRRAGGAGASEGRV